MCGVGLESMLVNLAYTIRTLQVLGYLIISFSFYWNHIYPLFVSGYHFDFRCHLST
jgi:hypothetical protein